VHFIVSGDDDETKERTLSANRPILECGSVDSFIMAVPRYKYLIYVHEHQTQAYLKF
jgi:hypothetical protein